MSEIKTLIRKDFRTVCEVPDGYDNIRAMEGTFIATSEDKEPIIYNTATNKWNKIEISADYGAEEISVRWKAGFNEEKKVFEFSDLQDTNTFNNKGSDE